MESILSMHDEVYPVKFRRHKSYPYLTNSLHLRRNTLNNQTNLFSVFYQYIKAMVTHRTLYILGILNLILAGVAILCVTQAEVHPEYFSLVYISISIFIFYMSTIMLIIISQIIQTYQEQQQRDRPSLPIQISSSISQINNPSNPIIVQSMITKTQVNTRLSRSHTLPLTSALINPHQTLSSSTSSSSLKDFNQLTSTRVTLLPKTLQPNVNIPKNYQSFALTTNDRFC